jgi:hypothetical protein
MSDKVIVMVSDPDDTSHGQLNVLESHEKAAYMVETLLESGFAQERIRIFNGDEMGMQVAHRPVVAFVSGPPSTNGTAPVQADSRAEETAPVVARLASKVKAAVQLEATAAPFVRNGVRFSTQFKPA